IDVTKDKPHTETLWSTRRSIDRSLETDRVYDSMLGVLDYKYDERSRLASVANETTKSSIEYRYDKDDNIRKSGSSTVYDARGRLTMSGQNAVQYDRAGRTVAISADSTSRGQRIIRYGIDGHPSEIIEPNGETLGLAFDDEGNLSTAKSNKETLNFIDG